MPAHGTDANGRKSLTSRYRVRLEGPPRRSRAVVTARTVVIALAIVGALLAGLTLFGKGRGSGAQVIARVGATSLTVQDLKAEARAQGRAARAALTPDLLEAVIDRTLLAQEARRRKLERAPSFPSDQRRAEAQVLASTLLRSLPRPPAPSPDQVASYIASHAEAFGQRRRLVLDELRYPATGAPELQDMTLEEARARLAAAKIRYVAFEITVFTGALPPPLVHAILSASQGHIAIVRDGELCTAVQVVSDDPAPLEGFAAELAASDAMAQMARERLVAELVKRLKVQTPLRVSPASS